MNKQRSIVGKFNTSVIHPMYLFIAGLIMLSSISSAKEIITVNSLSELKACYNKDNVHVKMTPGTYRFDLTNCGAGKLFSDPTLVLLTGSNCTFDFTGVTFEFDTKISRAYGKVEVIEFQVVGKKSVYLNLTMEDIGEVVPTKSILCCSLDGEDNRIEGFHATLRGSSPYGYSDMFGKGRGAMVGLHKHGACQFRGKRNHLKDCSFILRSWGHGIFIQGAEDALVEGCYVEGEMRTTDEVLAEKGSGSIADKLNFITQDGIKVPPGWKFSCQEDGIRAYANGIEYGTGNKPVTKNVRVINCTVKNMRSGIVIGHASGTKYAEGCTTIGCDTGYSMGSNAKIVNCKGDALYGPLYVDEYQRDCDVVGNFEVMYMDKDSIYGNDVIAYIAGNGNIDLTFTGGQDNPPAMRILVSGIRTGMRFMIPKVKYNDLSSRNIKVNNQTNYPLILAPKSSACTVTSVGQVTDLGTDNIVNQ